MEVGPSHENRKTYYWLETSFMNSYYLLIIYNTQRDMQINMPVSPHLIITPSLLYHNH